MFVLVSLIMESEYWKLGFQKLGIEFELHVMKLRTFDGSSSVAYRMGL